MRGAHVACAQARSVRSASTGCAVPFVERSLTDLCFASWSIRPTAIENKVKAFVQVHGMNQPVKMLDSSKRAWFQQVCLLPLPCSSLEAPLTGLPFPPRLRSDRLVHHPRQPPRLRRSQEEELRAVTLLASVISPLTSLSSLLLCAGALTLSPSPFPSCDHTAQTEPLLVLKSALPLIKAFIESKLYPDAPLAVAAALDHLPAQMAEASL